MYRLQMMVLLAFLATAAAWAQDAEPEASEETQTEEAADSSEQTAESAADEVTDEEIDELLGLDEDYTDVEDDDFEASVEVSFDQSVAFPADI